MKRDEDLIKELINKGADSTVKNRYGRTPIEYYQYTIRAADFEKVAGKKQFECLKKELPEGEAMMPEVSDYFDSEVMQLLGVWRRNNKPVNMDIFKMKTQQIIEAGGSPIFKSVNQDSVVTPQVEAEKKNQLNV